MAGSYEKDIERSHYLKLRFAIFGATLSIGVFMLFGLGLIPMEKGDSMPLIVTGVFLLGWLVKLYLQDELPWHRRYAVICGVLYVLAMVLVYLQDMRLPGNP